MTGLSLVEEHGLDALTMRRVAAALQVTPMSLYNHVSDKAELVDLMVDFVIGDVVAKSAQDTGDWETRLRLLVQHNHDMWREHPGFVRVYTEGVTMGPNALANCEQAIGILREAGFTDEDAGAAFLMLYRWIVATLLVAPMRPLGRDRERPPGSFKSKHDRLSFYFSALPLEEIPNIEATVMYLSGTSIKFGLDIIIAGLKARLAATKAEADGTAQPDAVVRAREVTSRGF
ncbi:MAG: TetR/AcrR family transcriptional regulator [Actinomycetota bacterium]|nr:TetR/AcrR family transcriptional regulator [Actinomycetota bacterium]